MTASIRLLLLLAMMGLCRGASADSYPDRPIHIVVPLSLIHI